MVLLHMCPLLFKPKFELSKKCAAYGAAPRGPQKLSFGYVALHTISNVEKN